MNRTIFPCVQHPTPRFLTPAVLCGLYCRTLTSVLLQAHSPGITSRRAEVISAASGLSEMGGSSGTTLPPRPVQQFDFRQALADHGGEEQGKENAADQHVVVVVFEHVELLRGVDPGLVDVQAVSHNLRRKTYYWPCVDSALKIQNKIKPDLWKKKQNTILSLTRQVDSNPEGAVWIPRTLDTVWL